MVVRLVSLPIVAMGILLLVAPAAAQAPEDAESQGTPPDGPGNSGNGQGNGPPAQPPGWDNGNGAGNGGGNGGNDPTDDAPAEPAPDLDNQTASRSMDATVRTATCRPISANFSPAKSPAAWARLDPDGCYHYMIKRLLEPGV